REDLLGAGCPQEFDKRIHELAVSLGDIALDDDDGVFALDGAAGIYDFVIEFPARAVIERFLFVGNQRVAKPVFELGAGATRGRSLGDHVLPDTPELRFCASFSHPQTQRAAVLGKDSPLRAAGGARVPVNDTHTGLCQVAEIRNLPWISAASENNKWGEIQGAAMGQLLPRRTGKHARPDEASRIQLCREDADFGGNPEDNLIGDGPRPGKR